MEIGFFDGGKDGEHNGVGLVGPFCEVSELKLLKVDLLWLDGDGGGGEFLHNVTKQRLGETSTRQQVAAGSGRICDSSVMMI